VLAVPTLTLGGKPIAPEALCVKTVLTRCMGPLEDWDDIFSQLAGYNAVHLTPVQQLDGSAYCIRDHFEPAASMGVRPVAWDKFAAALRAIREERKLLFFSDLVWNHMSSAAPFLRKHPEAGFSVTLDEASLKECNSPHLAPALALDLALQGVTGFTLGSEADVVGILEHVSTVVWQTARVWEYFVVDVEAAVAAFKPGAVRAEGTFDELLERFKTEGVECTRAGARLAWRARSPSTLFADEKEFRVCVETFNLHKYRELDADKEAVLVNLGHRLRYLRTIGSSLLFEPFFALVDPAKGIYCACNGWTVDNKKDDSIYLRRELIVWSDLVKLRFGDAPASSPALWKLMEDYTQRTAELFDGIRVDNAHTTPLHVAKHMIDVARRVRPDVYVVAELFADADSKKIAYICETGVHSVILEAMRAWEPFELSRLMHMCGGKPVGSIAADYPLRSLEALAHPPAMFMDCSHDNRTPAEERTVADTLSNGACVWSTHTSVGSTWGADELVPVNISVAKETRQYPKGPRGGITRAKAALGELHQRLGDGGFSEIFVESLERGLIVAQRANPETHETAYFLIRTAFAGTVADKDGALFGHTLRTRDARVELACCFSLLPSQAPASAYAPHAEFINGLAGFELKSEPARMCKIEQRSNHEWTVELLSFPLGSVVCARGFPAEVSIKARQELYASLLPSCKAALANVTLTDLNIILYRCAPEERSTTDTGAYNFPGWRATTYCGLAGVHQLMLDSNGDLGSPIYQHLREGNWLMSYCWQRLERHAGLAPAVMDLARWLRRADDLCGAQPRHLVPKYFTLALSVAVAACRARCVELMPGLRHGELALQLALGSVQMYGSVPNSDVRAEISGQPFRGNRSTLAAGLPHFSTGFMRCWGRDTCIALRGFFVLTGRLDEARDLLRAFASCVKNGIVPNLLDGAGRPRHNSRDSSWWWLHALQALYRQLDKEGRVALLRHKVKWSNPFFRFLIFLLRCLAFFRRWVACRAPA
jgi:glycogen debranching enzyme